MHHVIVTRVSLSFSALVAVCILGFAALVNRPAPSGPEEAPVASAGEALFKSHCGRCHGVDELAADLAAATDREARMAELVAFLESHGRASAGEDQAILRYLARQH